MDQDLEVPEWCTLGSGLESLLHEFKIDLSAVGVSRRLDTGLSETILYHIFLKLDARETRKKFRNLYPSQSPQKRKLFAEKAIQFITEKDWYPARVSTSLLSAGGGAPYRRLLGHLVRRAADKEIELLVSKQGPTEELSDNVDEAYNIMIKRQSQTINDALIELSRLEKRIAQLNSLKTEILAKWNDLARNFLNLEPIPPFQENYLKLFSERFKDSIKRGRAEFKVLVELAQQAETDPSFSHKCKNYESRKSKRISELLYQIRHKLGDNDVVCSNQTSTKRIVDRFNQYDHNMRGLTYDCERAVEKEEEALLSKPEFLEKFKLFEEAIPRIDIKPILADEPQKPIFPLLEKTLRKYLDSNRYNIEEVVDCARELHQLTGV